MDITGPYGDVRITDRLVSGRLVGLDASDTALPLLICIHGGGCNSGYFDIKGHSTLAEARERGFPVLLINRPGHGGNPPLALAQPIAGSVPRLRDFIAKVMGKYFPTRPAFLLGHSIGAAIVLMLATERHDWALSGVAVSGVGDESTARHWTHIGGFSPDALNLQNFLGPDHTWAWKVLLHLRRVSEPWILDEIAEIRTQWPQRWISVAASIRVPVHLRIAEHETIWRTGHAVIKRMAAALVRSPYVDASILEEGGHLYELHKRGPDLIASQLHFAEQTIQHGRSLN